MRSTGTLPELGIDIHPASLPLPEARGRAFSPAGVTVFPPARAAVETGCAPESVWLVGHSCGLRVDLSCGSAFSPGLAVSPGWLIPAAELGAAPWVCRNGRRFDDVLGNGRRSLRHLTGHRDRFSGRIRAGLDRPGRRRLGLSAVHPEVCFRRPVLPPSHFPRRAFLGFALRALAHSPATRDRRVLPASGSSRRPGLLQTAPGPPHSRSKKDRSPRLPRRSFHLLPLTTVGPGECCRSRAALTGRPEAWPWPTRPRPPRERNRSGVQARDGRCRSGFRLLSIFLRRSRQHQRSGRRIMPGRLRLRSREICRCGGVGLSGRRLSFCRLGWAYRLR